MDNEHSAFYSEEATNRLKKILNESQGNVLDESLLMRIKVELEKINSEIAKLLKGLEISSLSKNFEEQIRKKSKKFEDIMNVIGEGLCLLDKNLRVIWANKTIYDWLDMEESPVGNCCKDIFRCNEAGIENCQALNVFNGGEGHMIETWITTKTKKRKCVQRIAIPITSEKGDINNVLVHTVDVTESEKSVHRLILLQQLGEVMQGTLHLDKLLHLILACVTSGYAFGFNRAMLFLIDKEQNVLNGKLAVGPSSPKEAYRIWREMSSKFKSLEDIILKLDYSRNIDTPFNNMTKLMAYSLADEKEIVTTCAREKRPIVIKDAVNDFRVTQEFKNALGANEFICVPLIAKDKIKGVIVADNIYTGESITEDRVSLLTMFANQAAQAIENAETYKRLEDKINELTKTQQRLFNSGKLAAIGSMASYIAHEIRNPLVTIGGFAKSISRFDFVDSRIKVNIDIIYGEVRRLEKILNNLMDISKPPIPEKINVQICEIIDNTCALMDNYLKERHINFYKEFDPYIPRILADPNQIKQVILNMLMNSVDSMPEGGNLTVKISTVGELIKIDIIDTGKGMSQEELEKIFNPLFTTKSGGTGVGLAISLKVIEDHGGKIDAKSECGKGTTMLITLPIG